MVPWATAVIRVVALLAILVVPGVAAAAEITVLCARGMQHVFYQAGVARRAPYRPAPYFKRRRGPGA